MSEIKSHEFEGFLQRAPRSGGVFLIYGPDRGLVSERAGQLARLTGVPLDDAFSVLRITASDLVGQPGRLLDEMNAIGLFGGDRLVWLKDAGNEKPLIEAIGILDKEPPRGCSLIIEAGDLKKGAGLRKAVEGSRSAIAIPCYADDTRALSTLIDTELDAAGLRIVPAARQRLMESIGGDRLASRNEVRKLALYCHGRNVVEEEDVMAAIGDASAISVDDAVDAILKGDNGAFLNAMQKIMSSKTPVFLVLQACLRQFQLLELMRAEMDEKRTNASQVIATMGRQLHFRRKPVVEQALKKWSLPAIRREAGRLQSAILQSRQRSSLEGTIALQTLLSTVLQSARN
ncbi:DNA polymerase III subunit delta [Rhizobium sp. TRM96647]|uniref:DNA polymerase III subunit delta n=1 Tax=unclassified Rhizobium TaxID=2613769 RepID=UPI0021E89249|nr:MULTISPECIES: DNA polymerase III subunit delta [unclassified Rhizobium]MCV3735070.1 DNA polymerase III subunit delta [Rhizobium sp. TRM96647]MCV3757440.1 DNA polymerase III subunit delta [Rhizobium sp. TRM96650]